MARPETAVSATPLLFADGDWPEQTILEQQAKRLVTTGKIALRDKERCDGIVEDWFRMSLAALERKYAVRRTTIAVIIEAYREAGKLGDFKQRAVRRLESIIELAEHRLIEKLEDDKVPANVLPIVLGVGHDKKGQLEAGLVPGTSRTVEDVGLERYAAMLEAVRLRVKAASEAQSEAPGPFAGETVPGSPLETAQETPDASPTGLATTAPEGGGGVGPGPAGAGGGPVPLEIGKEQKDLP